jgi:nicotinate-nucleotide--dimethylbenzimidazole phosphoribosyltransferase
VFCPNCGTKNDETATPCKKCGFQLTAAPKFRGTMMLNSEQSVHDMVEEHRRKLAESGGASTPAEKPVGAPAAGAPPPPSSVPGAPKAVLQPPRAGLAKRRMGTMLGVAPQIGGVQPPPEVSGTPTPAPAGPPRAVSSGEEEAGETAAPSAPNPLGSTVAFGAVPPSPPVPAALPLGSSRPEAFATVASASAPLAAGRTEAFAVAPAPGLFVAGRTEAFAAPAAPSTAAGRTEAVAAAPEPAAPAVPASPSRGRTEMFDTSAPETAAPPPSGFPGREPEPRVSSVPPAPRRRVRPLDVFLIVITFGLYGLVLWARQRKASPP